MPCTSLLLEKTEPKLHTVTPPPSPILSLPKTCQVCTAGWSGFLFGSIQPNKEDWPSQLTHSILHPILPNWKEFRGMQLLRLEEWPPPNSQYLPCLLHCHHDVNDDDPFSWPLTSLSVLWHQKTCWQGVSTYRLLSQWTLSWSLK